MASAYYNASLSKAEDDELDMLFKTFDSQFQDLQQKFTDLERTMQEMRKEKSPEEEDNAH
jgi:Skp family chaperone for outer membrane proteins